MGEIQVGWPQPCKKKKKSFHVGCVERDYLRSTPRVEWNNSRVPCGVTAVHLRWPWVLGKSGDDKRIIPTSISSPPCINLAHALHCPQVKPQMSKCGRLFTGPASSQSPDSLPPWHPHPTRQPLSGLSPEAPPQLPCMPGPPSDLEAQKTLT